MRSRAGSAWFESLFTCAIAALALLVVGASPARAQSEQVEYYGLDAIGSVRVVFDPAGTILGRIDFMPFGEDLSGASNLPNQRFAGLFRDGEVGFDYAEARLFQPRSGRFNAPDPIYSGLFEPQRWNRYVYASSSPLTFVDPSGLDPFRTWTVGCEDPRFSSWAECWWKVAGIGGYGASPAGNTGTFFGQGPPPGRPGGGRGGPQGPAPGVPPPTNTNPTPPPIDRDEEDWHQCTVRLANHISLASLADLVGVPTDNWTGQTLLGNDLSSLTMLGRAYLEGDWTWGAVGNVFVGNPFPFNLLARITDIAVQGVGPRDIAVGRETPSGHYEVDRFERRWQPPKAVKLAGGAVKAASGFKIKWDVVTFAGAGLVCVGK